MDSSECGEIRDGETAVSPKKSRVEQVSPGGQEGGLRLGQGGVRGAGTGRGCCGERAEMRRQRRAAAVAFCRQNGITGGLEEQSLFGLQGSGFLNG